MKITSLGPDRVGFVLTNGHADCLVLDDGDKDEYRTLMAAGWKLVRLEPICRSQLPKLIHNRKDLKAARVYSYTLAILEKPRPGQAGAGGEAHRFVQELRRGGLPRNIG
jgi:hypothetical protein